MNKKPTGTSIQSAKGQIASLKTSIFNAMGRLGDQAELARERDDHDLADQLDQQIVKLSMTATQIYRAEKRLRGSALLAHINALKKISGEGRGALKDIETAKKALKGALKLIKLATSLAALAA